MTHRAPGRAVVASMAAAVVVAVTVCAGSPASAADAVVRHDHQSAARIVLSWNSDAGRAAIAGCIAPLDNPLTESRAYAMMQIAVHDALNAIDRRYQPYIYDARAPRGASIAAAVATAAHDVLIPTLGTLPQPFPASCGTAATTVLQTRYAASLAAIPDGHAKTAGISVGRAAAAAILGARSTDGAATPLVDPNYPQGRAPGQWRFTPDRPFAFGPGWGEVKPFALKRADQFRPGPPPALTSAQYTRDFIEAKSLGGDGTTTASARTADQTEIALFWLQSSPLMWNAIARTIAGQRHLDPWQTARMLALLDVALADGYIASFNTKYHYRFWRPVTAIRQAGTDGNSHTTADPAWTPLATTPAIPDYESAHAVQGAAAAAVLRAVLNTDRVSFSACSYSLPAGGTCADAHPVLRRFTRLSQAAQENADSRVLIGFHFRTAVDAGSAVGHDIARFTVQHIMAPSRHR